MGLGMIDGSLALTNRGLGYLTMQAVDNVEAFCVFSGFKADKWPTAIRAHSNESHFSTFLRLMSRGKRSR